MISSMTSISLTVFQDTMGEYLFKESTYYIDLCPPAHNWAFHFLIFLMGSLFLFINQTICSGVLYFVTCLEGITFQCPWSMWYCNYSSIVLINYALSGRIRASSRCMVPGSDPMKTKTCLDIMAIG